MKTMKWNHKGGCSWSLVFLFISLADCWVTCKFFLKVSIAVFRLVQSRMLCANGPCGWSLYSLWQMWSNGKRMQVYSPLSFSISVGSWLIADPLNSSGVGSKFPHALPCSLPAWNNCVFGIKYQRCELYLIFASKEASIYNTAMWWTLRHHPYR